MNKDKGITVTEFKFFRWTIFKIIKRFEWDYFEDVEPLLPITEVNVNKQDFDI